MPVPDRREAVDRHLLRDTAYTALRDAIVEGTLAPGEVLHDNELCEWLALSRTPVRAALMRLHDDGLVELAPQRYTRVACVSRRDVREMFPLLAAVHGLATELAVPRLTKPDLTVLQRENETLVAALRERNAPAAYAADERFHAVFVRVSANREIARSLAPLSARLARLERLVTDILPGRRSVAQHQAIATRAAAGDARAAASAARENWMTLGALLDRSLAGAEPAQPTTSS
jgi:DNA-binding GntR family transcriptional regulator